MSRLMQHLTAGFMLLMAAAMLFDAGYEYSAMAMMIVFLSSTDPDTTKPT